MVSHLVLVSALGLSLTALDVTAGQAVTMGRWVLLVDVQYRGGAPG